MFIYKLPSPDGCEAIILGALAFVRQVPGSRDPALCLQPVKRGIQGARLDLEQILRGPLNMLCDRMAMRGARLQRAENKKIQRALKEFNAIHCVDSLPHDCVECLRPVGVLSFQDDYVEIIGAGRISEVPRLSLFGWKLEHNAAPAIVFSHPQNRLRGIRGEHDTKRTVDFCNIPEQQDILTSPVPVWMLGFTKVPRLSPGMCPWRRPTANCTPSGCYFGCGTIRKYGLGDFQPPGYFCFASSSDTDPAMITSSPLFQFTGVATLWLAVSWMESSTRRTSSKFRPVVIG